MSRCTEKGVSYAPMYIHTFHLVQPHTLVEAEKFNIHYTDLSQIDNTPDKLRWYRYNNGLLQREVARYVGLDRQTYSRYEEFVRDYYPIETMKKLAKLYSIPVTDLLDDYNLFLYKGQGRQIRKMRAKRRMTQSEYARRLGVPLGTLKEWEQDRIRMFKGTWEKLIARDRKSTRLNSSH